MNHSYNNQSGIAVREIIIAIVLLAIFCVLAIPFFTSKQGATQRQISANNLKQWGIALNLFMIENDNQLPSVGTEDITAKDNFAWYNSLPPYLSLPSLAETSGADFPKPGMKSIWVDPSAKLSGTPPPKGAFFTYGVNVWLQPNRNALPYKIYDIEDPSTLVFMTEINGFTPSSQPKTVEFRHRKKNSELSAHVLYADGHVELVDRPTLSDHPAVEDPKGPQRNCTWIPFYDAPKP